MFRIDLRLAMEKGERKYGRKEIIKLYIRKHNITDELTACGSYPYIIKFLGHGSL